MKKILTITLCFFAITAWGQVGNNGKKVSQSHEYVDLGLSVKWATCNVGANKPEGYGDYFAWGETNSKSDFSWETYKWGNGKSYTNLELTKYIMRTDYNTDNERVDNCDTLALEDDAARARWGGEWRMPTKEEQDELVKNCTWTWTTRNGVKGYLAKSKRNGKSIFLPAAGCYIDGSVSDKGSWGCYWSSSININKKKSMDACFINFSPTGVHRISGYRCDGQSVRAVCP